MALLLALLISTNIWLTFKNRGLSETANRMRTAIINAERVGPILTDISFRLAKQSEKYPELKELLKKHELKINVEVEGVKKSYP